MNPRYASILAAIAAVLFVGCLAVPFNDPNDIGAKAAARLEKQVPTYQESQLANRNDYIRAGSVETYLCRHSFIGTFSDEEVIMALRQKARAAGANGLTDVSCEPGPVDEISGCVSSIACQATMIKTVSSAEN
jgi:hypothetical protein